eukprot:4953225-Prymnesium_polylepis.1
MTSLSSNLPFRYAPSTSNCRARRPHTQPRAASSLNVVCRTVRAKVSITVPLRAAMIFCIA